MLEGCLDAVLSTGHVSGWAYDPGSPDRPLIVSLRADDGRELAWGRAHDFRDDLADAKVGTGWCAFGLKLAEWPIQRPWRALNLVERRGGQRIFQREALPYVVEPEAPLETIEELIAADPTMLRSLDQLRACNGVLGAYIDAHGLDAFVRTAYIYLLGRPADAAGFRSYRNHARANKQLTPYELLRVMSDSDEYRSQRRLHSAPTMSAFPFRLD